MAKDCFLDNCEITLSIHALTSTIKTLLNSMCSDIILLCMSLYYRYSQIFMKLVDKLGLLCFFLSTKCIWA